MREGWRSVTVGEVVRQVRRPVDVRRDDLYRLLGMRWYGGGPFLRETVQGSEIKAKRLFLVRRRDFIYNRLFAWKGSFGVIGTDLEGCYVSGEFPLFECELDALVPEFLDLVFDRPEVWFQIEKESTGSTATSRNRWKEEQFLQWHVELPSPSEQRRIVDLLDSIVVASDAAKALVCSARQACARLRDNLISGSTQRLSELLLEIDGGLSPVTEGRPPAAGERAVLKLSAIRSGRFLPAECKAIAPNVKMPQKAAVRAGDVLITRSNTSDRVGDVALVDEDNPRLFLSDLTLRLHPRREILSPAYLAEALLTSAARAQIEGSARGTSGSMKKISRSLIRTFDIPVPPIEEQEKVVALIAAARNLEVASDVQAGALSRLRSSVLTGVLSGEHVIPDSYDELVGLPG